MTCVLCHIKEKEYVMIHFRKENNRAICSIARLGIQLTDDPSETTFKICLRSLNKKQPEFCFRDRERKPKVYIQRAMI